MKVFRFPMVIVLGAALGAFSLALGARSARALEVAPTLPFPPPTFPTNPVFPIVAIKYFGPERELCASASGAVTARAACRASERTLDPTGLKLCASASGALSVSAPTCRKGSSEVDLRAVRNSSPPTWFGTSNAPPPFEVISPIQPIAPPFPVDPAPFPFPTGKVLCKRSTGLSLRLGCLPSETTVHPSALMACVTRAGSLSVEAGTCGKRETRLDLRAVRGPSSHPIGIGPLVGLVPSLADLVAEYGD